MRMDWRKEMSVDEDGSRVKGRYIMVALNLGSDTNMEKKVL